jgi:serine/threonine-protein kinase
MPELNPERWREVSAYLDQLLEIEPAERGSWLEREIADPELRAEVAALGAKADRTAGVLDGAAGAHLGTLLREEGLVGEPAASLVGTRVGPYQIAREIGRGGMGVVFLAERADGQFEQRVALKLIKRGLDTDEILGRFQRERQILAQLEHPSIARLLDGGVSEDGQPYFAMEYVEGEPITTYCDRRRLAIRDRLRLFVRVCDAVQYAHRNLVVHRDLKPSNILVTEEGEPKLVDFGIAKLVTEEATATLVTHAGVRPLTPAYAAPEQLRGEPVTTATDVYGLGVVLYELLSGRRPHGEAGTSVPELQQAVLETDPAPPSARVSGTPTPSPPAKGKPSTDEIAAARQSTAASLARHLAGDLDAIVLTALRKEPERRYSSASVLRQDLGRHLDHQPILARPDGALYRAGKFMRRHRFGVAATALVISTLAIGLFGTLSQARAKAIEARKAEEVKDFVLALFEASDPSRAQGEEITARELLDRGAERIESELGEQPEVQAEITGVVGMLYRELGLYDQADGLLTRSLDQNRSLYGRESLEAAAALDRLAGVLHWGRGDYEGAEAAHREVLALRERLLGSDDPLVAESLTSLAAVVSDEGDYEEAIALHRRALAIDRAAYGDDSEQTATDLANLAVVLWHQGLYDEAEPLHREALDIRRRLLGESHPDTASSLHGLASLLSTQGGDYDEAEELFQRAIELRKKIFGPDNPEVTYSLENYAILLERRGDLAAAKPLELESLEIRRKTLGPDHPDLAVSLNNFGVLCYRLSDFEEAERYFREALAIWEKELGREHPSVASCLNNIGMIRLELGDPAAAEPLVRESMAIRRRTLGDEHVSVAQSHRNLGLVLLDLGRITQAEAMLTEGLELGRRIYPEGNPRIAELLVALAQTWLEQGRYEEAEPLLREALGIRTEKMETGDWRVAEAELFLGLSLTARGASEEGRDLLGRSVDTLRSQRGEDHRLTRRAAAALGSL